MARQQEQPTAIESVLKLLSEHGLGRMAESDADDAERGDEARAKPVSARSGGARRTDGRTHGLRDVPLILRAAYCERISASARRGVSYTQ